MTGYDMLGTHDLALFVLTVSVLAATPGVDWLSPLARTRQLSARTGAFSPHSAL